MGKPGAVNTASPASESIGCRGEPGELKHLSTPRKRKQHAIPQVAASERGKAQTRWVQKAAAVAHLGLQVNLSQAAVREENFFL